MSYIDIHMKFTNVFITKTSMKTSYILLSNVFLHAFLLEFSVRGN